MLSYSEINTKLGVIIRKVEWHNKISGWRNKLVCWALVWLLAARFITPPLRDSEVIVAIILLAANIGLAIYAQKGEPK